MRILLLYASAGGGHKRAAQAMEAYFREHLPGAEVRVEDALRHVGRAVNALCCDGYKFSAKHAPQIFGTLYRSTNRDTKFAALLPRVNGMLARKLLPLIEEFRPDVILDTYHFAGQMVSRLKEKGLVSAPLVNVVTDYGPHMAWLAPEVDAYVVAEDGLRDAFVRMGAPKEKIHTFGIPIFEAFYQEEDRASLLRGMNLSPELPTVLIMAGSFGVKNILRVYRDISTLGTAFQVIVITGKNKTLYEAFQKELPNSSKPTHLVEFTTEVQKYMHASDLLITKPSELSFYPVPKLMIQRVGGHEAWGAVRAAEVGDGTYEMDDPREICGFIDCVQEDRSMIVDMCARIRTARDAGIYDGAYRAVELAVR